MWCILVEAGIEAGKKQEEEFFKLAGRFRAADDPAEVKRLGKELGRLVFWRGMPRIQP